jgi:hypothetical protein
MGNPTYTPSPEEMEDEGRTIPTTEEAERALQELDSITDELLEGIADNDVTEEELEITMKLLEYGVEKSQQMHSACRKRLYKMRGGE